MTLTQGKITAAFAAFVIAVSIVCAAWSVALIV